MNKTELTSNYAEKIADLFSSLSFVPIEDIKENMENGETKFYNLAEFGQIAWDDAETKCISSSNAATFSVDFVSQNLELCVNSYNTNVEETKKIEINDLAFWGLYDMLLNHIQKASKQAQNLLNEYWDKVDELEMEETE